MEKRYIANKNYILREIAGEPILVSVGSGIADFCGIVNLNTSAKVLWNTLQEAVTEEDLVAVLKETFSVEEEKAKEDVGKTIDFLLQKGLIVYE